MDDVGTSPNRLERRKQRTRAALIKAAQSFIGAGKLNVPVQDIKQAADVGVGSFYNHFDSKEQLFQVAVNEVLDAQGALVDALTESIEDPAEMFACRLPPDRAAVSAPARRGPCRARLRAALDHVRPGTGTAGQEGHRGRGRGRAVSGGRSGTRDGGQRGRTFGRAVNSCTAQPERDDAQAVDQVTESVLILFGLAAARGASALPGCRCPILKWSATVGQAAS